MNWKNLQENLCPNCEAEMKPNVEKDRSECTGCRFMIGLPKLRKMLDSMDAQTHTEMDNQASDKDTDPARGEEKQTVANALRAKQGGPDLENSYFIPEATKSGYARADVGDSINLSVPKSKTRRGRIGKGTAQTIDTGMQQHTIDRGGGH